MKKTHIALLLALPAALALAGCGHNDGPYPSATADYFVKHPAAYKAQSAWCAQQFQAGRLKVGDPACTAAAQARQMLAEQQYFAAPKWMTHSDVAAIPKPETFGQAMQSHDGSKP